MSPLHKEMVWLGGKLETPPMPSEVRIEAGYLFRLVQAGIPLSLPHSRPMPSIGRNCHELRVNSNGVIWRFFYCISPDAIVSLGFFCKKTQKTPKQEIGLCKMRLKNYYTDLKGGSK
jgi:phage-related protein